MCSLPYLIIVRGHANQGYTIVEENFKGKCKGMEEIKSGLRVQLHGRALA
jgi:hypothetical protein